MRWKLTAIMLCRAVEGRRVCGYHARPSQSLVFRRSYLYFDPGPKQCSELGNSGFESEYPDSLDDE